MECGRFAGATEVQFPQCHRGRRSGNHRLADVNRILFGTQLSIFDGFTRVVADHIWAFSERMRHLGDVRYIYYPILIIFAIWGCIAINLARPMILLIIGANIAAFIFVFSSALHLLQLLRAYEHRETHQRLG